jgi:hypothetical protein
MSSPRRLAIGLIAVTVLIGVTGTGCQSSPSEPQGSTVKSQMPDLPKDEDAAKAVVRKMLMGEAIVLLKASGLKYSAAQFDVPISFDDDNTQNGDLSIQFQACSHGQEQAMTNAISANGWEQGSISHGVNVRKGPLYLQWGGGVDGCRFDMTTVNISQHLHITDDRTNVPELAAFKDQP